MPHWRFWEKNNTTQEPGSHVARTATVGEPVPKPPPVTSTPISDAERAQRIAKLNRRREGALYDLAQAELAFDEDNPWRQRIALLSEALETVDQDRERLKQLPNRPTYELPAIPITIQEIRTEDPPSVSFAVGDQPFRYEEEIDWAERGTTVVRGELQLREGNPSKLPLGDVPLELRDELIDHLTDSLFAFATDIRDLASTEEPLPDSPTLSDLARPCPECGGWQDWNGHCPECQRRGWQRQQLDAEAERLERERASELDDQAKWAERLPVARKRLADIDAELAALGA